VRRRWALPVLGVALAAAGLLIGLELSRGGLSYGAPEVRDPCARHAPFPGDGIEATTQRVALRGLDLAGCELGVTREEVLLAIAGEEDIGRSSEELEDAVRHGLEQAVEEEDLNPAAEFVLRQAILLTPEEWVLGIARGLGLL
jgi:hypothetical protein